MSSSEPVAELPLDTAGTQLMRAREALGKSRTEIAATTRIQERYLAALDESRYADLPSRTYALGFARSYARAVGLNGNTIGNVLRAELDDHQGEPAPIPTPAFTPGDPARAPSARFAKLAGVALAIVAGAVAVWHGYFQPAGSLPSLLPAPSPSAQASPSAQVNSPAATAAPAANVAAGAVVFTALTDGLWVKFYDGAGKQLMQKQMAKGESYTVPADAQNPMLWTGRPDQLAITIGGKAQPLLSPTQKTMQNVPVTAAALLARGAAVAPLPGATKQIAAPATAAHSAPRHHAVVSHHTHIDAPASAPTTTPAPVAAPPAPTPAPKPSTVTP